MTAPAAKPASAQPATEAWYNPLLDRGAVPDAIIRSGIRRLLRERLNDEGRGGLEAAHARAQAMIAQWWQGPIAIETAAANEQHYEVPAEFYLRALGPRLKYSSAYYARPEMTLGEAEECMLALTCERAALADGQRILELGCGWGSLTLWMAEHYPKAQITAVSNSASQRAFIEGRAREKGFTNVTVITCDINRLELPAAQFDRCVSVEMFEHCRNHRELFRRVAGWLAPAGQLFVHVFTHRDYTYAFEPTGDNDWMARHFFTGGIMPSDHYLLRVQDDFNCVAHWRVNGRHYQATSEAWLTNTDRHRTEVKRCFATVYGADQAERWLNRWRIFFMSCAELWGYREGEEWFVSHYRFARR